MTRNPILISLSALAIIAAAPALAKPGGGRGGQGHGMGGGHGQGMGGGHGHGMDGGMNSSMGRGTAPIDIGVSSRMHGRSNSTMGLGNAKLTGVTNGMSVVDSSGAMVGTVTGLSNRGNSGNLRNVQVTLTSGQVILLSPRSLSLNDGVLTTNSLVTTANALNRRVNSQGPFHASVQGLAHASPNSVLALGGSTITGLTLGMPVLDSGGVSLGPVTQLINNRNGQLVGIRVDLVDGGVVTIPARELMFTGGVLTTTFVPH